MTGVWVVEQAKCRPPKVFAATKKYGTRLKFCWEFWEAGVVLTF